jgi:valyl-tRNA synthetase
MQGASAPQPDIGGLTLSSPALDILAKCDDLVTKVTKGYAEYRFGENANLLYDFFWSDYCDWFVEASKSSIYGDDPEAKSGTLAVMDAVLHTFLRLLHPYMPHLTEELWQRLGFQGESLRNGVQSISFIRMPESGDLLKDLKNEGLSIARKETADLYESVSTVRNLRAEYNISTSKKIDFTIKQSMELAPEMAAVFSQLINAAEIKWQKAPRLPKGTPSALTPVGTIFMPLDGLIDVEAERARLSKEIVKLEADVAASLAKLANASFVDRAPAQVVEEHRTRVKEMGDKVRNLQKMLSALPT